MNFNKHHKKYKSLVDVYVDSRQNIEENVQIVGIPDGMDQENLGAVTEPEYQRIKRVVLSKAEGGLESLVKQLLRLGEWEEIADIDTLVLDIFLNYDVDIQILNKLVEKKKQKKLGRLEMCVNKTSVWNLLDSVDPLCYKLVKNFKQLFVDITRKVQPKINTVSVGPGEISLSMFTNATKGSVGDLMLNGMELEIKGDGGRLGSSDYTKAIFTTPGNKYLQLLANRGLDQHFSQAEAPQIRSQIAIKAQASRKNLQTLRKIAKKFPEVMAGIEGAYNQLDMNLEALEDVKSTIEPDVVRNNIQVAFDAALDYKDIPLNQHKGANANIGAVLNLLDKLVQTNVDKTDYNWQSSTQYMFNHDWGMSPRELAEAFVEMRTEEMDAGSVASLITASERFFKNKELAKSLFNLNPAVKGKTKTVAQVELQRLQAALMATSYQSVHGFERILVLNSSTLSASNIKFNPSHDAGQTLTSVYRQLKANANIHVSNPGVDQRNKGIGISVAK